MSIDSVHIFLRNLSYSAFNVSRKMFQSLWRKQRNFLEKAKCQEMLLRQTGFQSKWKQQQKQETLTDSDRILIIHIRIGQLWWHSNHRFGFLRNLLPQYQSHCRLETNIFWIDDYSNIETRLARRCDVIHLLLEAFV